ncbi:MAG: peptide deformylase [Gammaproteobacteria bacterium]|nr:peptide deformylase [Gammaproteobacteria bacterium]
MPILEILHFPDPRLRTKAQTIAHVSDEVRALAASMFETMYAAPGIGLAATQVNVHKRLIVLDISDDKQDPYCLINPELREVSGVANSEEGCLSVPDIFEEVTRSERIRVRALDLAGNKQEFEASGRLAICIQHEMDHLEGKLFVDRLSSLKRTRIRKKFEKQQRTSS